MALQKTISIPGESKLVTEHGEVRLGESSIAPSFYCKVERVACSKAEGVATVSHSAPELTFERRYTFPVDLGRSNFIAQAYVHIKTLPDYAGATDC